MMAATTPQPPIPGPAVGSEAQPSTVTTVKTRCFLVGCPRSGTTLLQSLLAAHSQVLSLPETAFFVNTQPSKAVYRLLERVGVTSRKSGMILHRCLDDVERPDLKSLIPRLPLGRGRFVQAFRHVMDQLTVTSGKTVWLEKSPRHVFCIDEIHKHIPDARFIHIVRNGADVVASLRDAALKYPKQWKIAQNLDDCIDMWNHSVIASRRHLHQPHHRVVTYELLVDQPEPVIRSVFEFLGLEHEPQALTAHSQAATSLFRPSHEPWKQGVTQGEVKKSQDKFSTLFDDRQQAYIRSRLEDVSDLAQAAASSLSG